VPSFPDPHHVLAVRGPRPSARRPSSASPMSTDLVLPGAWTSPGANTGSDGLLAHTVLRALPGSTGTTTTEAHTIEVPVGEKPQRTNVTVLLDTSRSMSGPKLLAARQAIVDMDAMCLTPGDTLRVLAFNRSLSEVLPVSKKVGESKAGRGAGRAGKPPREGSLPTYTPASLASALDALEVSGGTKLYDAVLSTLSVMQSDHDAYYTRSAAKFDCVRPRYMQLVVVTDGEDYGSEESLEAVRAYLGTPGEWAVRCEFQACLVGVGASASGELERLGGSLRHVRVIPGSDDAEAIKAAFKRVVDTIKETQVMLVTTLKTVVRTPHGRRGGV
jgi:hypothetical protein